MESFVIIHSLDPLDEFRVVVVLEEESLAAGQGALDVLHEQFKGTLVLFNQSLQDLLHDLVVLCMSTPPPLRLFYGCAGARPIPIQSGLEVGRVGIDEPV